MQKTNRHHLRRAVLSLLGGGTVVVVLSRITRFVYREVGSATAPALPLAVTLVLLASFAVLGGYVTSVIARRAEAAHALLLGLILATGQLASTLLLESPYPLWLRLALSVLFVPATISGAWLRVRQRGLQTLRK